MFEGNHKLIVAVVALVVVGVIGTWGPLTGEQVLSMTKIAIPTIIGTFMAANGYEHKLKKAGNGVHNA